MASVKDLSPYGIRLGTCRRISQDDYARLLREGCRPQLNDILVAKDGATALDTVCLMTEEVDVVLLSSVAIIRPNRHRVSPVFLRYYLDAPQVRDYMKGAFTSGAAIPRVVLRDFKKVRLSIPPRPEQDRIGWLLAAHDALIQNNSRRIQILDEMAERIYREWFVEFRYPGHGEVPLVESWCGMIPRGWVATTLLSTTDLLCRGISPKYANDSPHLVINQKCIRNRRLSLVFARWHASNVAEERLVRPGDVLVNSTGVGTLGRVAQVMEPHENVTVDSHVTIVRPAVSSVMADYFGIAMLQKQTEFEAMGVGSTGQTELGRDRIAGSTMLVPARSVQEAFASVVGPMRVLATQLDAENRILRSTRDLLLPRLISGVLDVSDLEIDTTQLVA